MLSDLADDSKEDPGELSMLHQRIRSMTERSGTAVRHFADLLNANGLYTDLASDIRRASERIMAKFEQDVTIEGEAHIGRLKPITSFDLFLFYKECLVNISRHSGATLFSTRLVATDGRDNLRKTPCHQRPGCRRQGPPVRVIPTWPGVNRNSGASTEQVAHTVFPFLNVTQHSSPPQAPRVEMAIHYNGSIRSRDC
jgi:hypothetical protein